jgi:hypothetical protein
MPELPTTTDKDATTRLACEIAQTNPDRFNEAVHANTYPCAPKTTPGKARSFDVDDIVALRIYQREMDNGMSAAAAGKKACLVREFMMNHPGARRVFILATDFRPWDRLVPEFDVNAEVIMINSKQGIDVVGFEMIDLDWHRARVVLAINSWRPVVGEAD